MTRNPFLRYTLYPLLLTLFFLIILTGCQKSKPETVVSAADSQYNQAYGADSLQQFDLFLPEGHGQKTKVVLLIHGGGWVGGDKWFCQDYARQFAAYGYAAVSMNYRLANDSIHCQEILADIDSMIGCITRNTGRWGVRNGQIALFGYSAGGHLALLYPYSTDPERHIGAVVSLAGPTDVLDSLLWQSPGLLDDIRLMTGDTVVSRWANTNPINFVSATVPATLLIHGINDEVVPVAQSMKLKQALDASSANSTLILMQNETHYYSLVAIDNFMAEAKKFLDANLK